jgi:hypothetical protein
MHYEIKNNTGNDFSILENLIEKFFPYAQENMNFDRSVTIVLESDLENAQNPLGKTAYYSPSDNTVVLYTDNRHPKDLMRSLSHELVHHKQNCNGELSEITGEQGYAQTETGHKIEEEAYSLGNTCFRNWEDSVKKGLNETSYNTRGDKKMKLTETKLREMIKEALKNVYLKQEEAKNNSDDTDLVVQEDSEEEAQIEDAAKYAALDAEKDQKLEEDVEKQPKIEEKKEKTLKSWWEESLYTNLVKKYTGGKK